MTTSIVTSHENSLSVRPSALTVEDAGKIDNLLNTHWTVKRRWKTVRVPDERDELGLVTRWRDDLIEDGWNAEAIGTPDPRLVEAIQRPAAVDYVVAHLTRLAAHLRFTKGAKAWQIVVDDVARDLGMVSEWALVRACAELRAADSPFFPDTPALLAKVREWDDFAKRLSALREEPESAPRIEDKGWQKPDAAAKARVAKIMHDGGLHAGKCAEYAEFCQQCAQERGNP